MLLPRLRTLESRFRSRSVHVHGYSGHVCATPASASRQLPLRVVAGQQPSVPSDSCIAMNFGPQLARSYTASESLLGLAQPVVLVMRRACRGLRYYPQTTSVRRPSCCTPVSSSTSRACCLALQGALDFERGPLASAADPVAGAALPLPLVVADQRFPVGLARLIRATLQPEAAFIEAHYSNMGYWAIGIEPWSLDAGARHSPAPYFALTVCVSQQGCAIQQNRWLLTATRNRCHE